MKFKLDENLPISCTAILTSAGHDVDTVTPRRADRRTNQDVVTAATAAERIPISPDRGLRGVRAYPLGSHTDIVVLRMTDQSAAAAATKEVSDLATLTNPDRLARWRRSCCADYYASAIPNQRPRSSPLVLDSTEATAVIACLTCE